MPKTLLAVDDSVTMRKVLEITFSSDDFRVLGAENSQKALAQLVEEPIAALIDTSLEGDDGYALAKQIRSRDPRIAIVLMASRYNPYDANRGRDAGADDYADKPFDTQGLLDKVKKAIVAREGQKAAPAPAPPATAPGPMAPPFAATPRPPITAAVPSRGPVPVGNRAHTLSFDSGPVGPPPATVPGQTPTMQHRVAPPPAASRPAVPPATAPVVSLGAPKTAPVASPSPHNVPTAAPPAAPAPSPAAPPVAVVAAVPAAVVNGQLAGKLDGLGLTPQQVEAVLSLSRDLVERVVWEVVPLLAETMIKEEIARLTKDG